MSYIQGVSRKQAVLFPDTVDDYIEEDDPARLMDPWWYLPHLHP